MKLVVLGLSITSSWGNGHATTYRGLVRELVKRNHDVLFLEREQPWYAANRDLPRPPFGRTEIYQTIRELKRRFSAEIAAADAVIVGSYVPDGVEIGEWVTDIAEDVTGFYDIDTPVTLSRLLHQRCDYLTAELIRRYDLYLSFTGGPTLQTLEQNYGSAMARALYCSVDPATHYPESQRRKWLLGYLGTFSEDREKSLNEFLVRPAQECASKRFVVAGPMYPKSVRWPQNVERITHLNPSEHRAFYNSQRFTLNITRAAMIEAGYSPSVRLFEAAACATPIISDDWPGLDTLLTPDKEILVARTTDDVLRFLRDLPEGRARVIGELARERVLAEHTAAHRAAELERFVDEARIVKRKQRTRRLSGVKQMAQRAEITTAICS
ncbi:MAG: glycosyltransferase [Chthoniobacterales bacterium]